MSADPIDHQNNPAVDPTCRKDRPMTAEEAIAIVRIAQHHAANEYVNAKMTEVMALIRRQADDLAAIEAVMRLPIDIDYDGDHDPKPWRIVRGGTQPSRYHATLADACRAATKGEGQ